MIYEEYLPTCTLQSYICRYWTLKTFTALPAEKVIPDGTIKLFIFLNDNLPEYRDNEGNLMGWDDGMSGHSLGGSISITVPSGVSVVGCSIKPSFFYETFKVPVHELNNTIVDLFAVFGREGVELKEKLQEAANSSAIVKVLNGFFTQQLTWINSKQSFVEYAQNELIRRKGFIQIDKLCEITGSSYKSIERRFIKSVGMTPKMYARVLRFNHAYHLQKYHNELDWSDISLIAGYYDQNHLIKEFKYFSGIAPNNFIDGDNDLKNLHLGR